MTARRTFLRPETIHAVSLPRWIALFDALGYPPGITPRTRDLAAIERALLEGGVPLTLLPALARIEALGNASGREAILEAARARGKATSDWPADEGVEELVVRLSTEMNGDAEIAVVLELAELRELRAPRGPRFREAYARIVLPLEGAAEKAEELRAAISAWCAENGRGDWAAVRVLDDAGEALFHVSHAQRMIAAVAVGARGLERVRYLPLRSDVVRYDPRDGRLRLATASPRLVPFYRELFGRVLFGDGDHFADAPTVTLRGIEELGQRALEAASLAASIARARITECTWDTGNGHLLSLKGNDCLGEMERLGLRRPEGSMREATVELVFTAGAPRTARVTLKPPNRVDVRPESRAPQCERYLAEIGVRPRPGGEAARDLWGLAGAIWSEPEWRARLRSAFEALATRGILVRALRTNLVHPDHPHAGAVLNAIAANEENETHYAVSADEDVAARLLNARELDGLRLDPIALARAVAKDLELEGAPSALSDDAVIYVGRRSLGPHVAHVLLAARGIPEPSALLVERVRAMTGAGLAVWLVPPGRDPPIAGARAVAFELTPSFRGLLPAIVSALGLVEIVDAALSAPPEARLFVDRGKKRVHLDGVPMARLSEIHFAYVEAVASARGAPVPKEELHARLSPNRLDDAMVRQAKARTLDAMMDSFADAGKEAPADLGEIFRSDRAGHRVTVAAFLR